ncbi:MAG: co-chaperone GroES [Bacteroidales bacterium]|nr:co-chaperone GroES [Bacteroidales bacterium]
MPNNDIDKLIVVGDRVLIDPESEPKHTKGGLLLPAGYQEKDEVRSGYIVKCGPGYALPSSDEGESWQPGSTEPRYLPLQVRPGDRALFLPRNAYEVKYADKRYFVVPQNAILMVERDDF